MIKIYCDTCGKLIEKNEQVRVTISNIHGLKNEGIKPYDSIFKDYCKECAIKLLGEDTVSDIKNTRDAKQAAREIKKSQDKDG